MTDTAPRYYAKKESGSHWVYVMDRESLGYLKRFNMLRGVGKNNGWDRADAMCKQLNDRAAASIGAKGDADG